MIVELSKAKKWSMSSREHDAGSARKSVAVREAFATARFADAMTIEDGGCSSMVLRRHCLDEDRALSTFLVKSIKLIILGVQM